MTPTSLGTCLAPASFLQFAFKEIPNLVHLLLLLIQEIHDDAHGGLLQPNALNIVLHFVLYVAQFQRGMDQNHCRKHNGNISISFDNYDIDSRL